MTQLTWTLLISTVVEVLIAAGQKTTISAGKARVIANRTETAMDYLCVVRTTAIWTEGFGMKQMTAAREGVARNILVWRVQVHVNMIQTVIILGGQCVETTNV